MRHRGVPSLGDVVLVTGPMGSGKSTLAQYRGAAARMGERQRGHLPGRERLGSGLRSPEQELVVQLQVIDHLLMVCRSGRSVVLEFIPYAEPPNPLSAYQHAFADNSVARQVIVLKPSIPEILRMAIPTWP